MKRITIYLSFSQLLLFAYCGYAQVGIGTTNPQSNFDIEGNMTIGSAWAGNASISAPSNGLLISGRMGIGEVNPSSRLYVNGGTQGHPLRVESGTNRGGMRLTNNITSGNGNTLEIRFQGLNGGAVSDMAQVLYLDSNYSLSANGGGYTNQFAFANRITNGSISWYIGTTRMMLLENDGDLRVKNSVFHNTTFRISDRRLQNDVQPVQNATLLLSSLKPVQFTKKETLDSKTSEEYGFIPQELKQLLPEITKEYGEKKLLAVDYTSLIPILVKAFQEEEQRSLDLRKRLALLKKKMEDL